MGDVGNESLMYLSKDGTSSKTFAKGWTRRLENMLHVVVPVNGKQALEAAEFAIF
jgi:hypothetical protein